MDNLLELYLRVLSNYIHNRAELFLDDVGIRGLKTTYNNEELAPGIRRFVVEHVQNLDAELVDLERAGITIALSFVVLESKLGSLFAAQMAVTLIHLRF